MNNFVQIIKLNVQMVFTFLGCLYKEKNKYIKFLLAALKTVTNSKDFSRSQIYCHW